MNNEKKDHLPLFGVGPLIVLPQLILNNYRCYIRKRGYSY